MFKLHTPVFIFVIGLVAILSCNNENSEIRQIHLSAEDSSKSKLNSDSLAYLKKGKEIATTAQKKLASNLLHALKKGGPAHAISFCNEHASTLLDSLENAENVFIKRVTDLPRNIKNRANQRETEYIQQVKSNMRRGETPRPFIVNEEGQMLGYYPIVTNTMCLQCHGKAEKDIALTTLNSINKLYPLDNARNYTENQLRGFWVVMLNKN